MSLIAHDISLGRDTRKRLKQVSLEVAAGQLTVVIGPNGSGKTSLLKVLSGDTTPDLGYASLDGINLQYWSAAELARHRAVMPQHPALDFPFQVRDVVALGRSPYRADQSKDVALVQEAMKLFDIVQLARRMYTTLSGGERQRVHLARVWAQINQPGADHAHFLLLDEPTSALDLKHQRGLMNLLRETVRSGYLGVVAALHDLNSAAQYADQLVLLNQGEIVATGTPQHVLTSGLIEEVYQVPVEFIRYRPGEKQVIAIPGEKT